MPRVTTGNTMAPCVIIGERAADMLTAQHTLKPATSADTGWHAATENCYTLTDIE
jgi:choline dehydrogenase-like flavoprotein